MQLPSDQLARVIAVARGDDAPDLVVTGASVFCAFTREWLHCDVAVAEGRIAALGSFPASELPATTRVIDGTGRFLVPGFIDAHLHIESSKLMVDEFARTVLPHGTTAVVAEPHELANVLGARGVHWFLDACAGLPLEVFVMAPSCVPASSFESPREPVTRHDIEAILLRSHALGIGEMMNFPGVISGSAAELDKLAAAGATHVDGHAPGVRGRALDAYIAAGITSDHESTTVAEALDKRRRGMWVLLRDASNAHNMLDLLPLVLEHGPDFCAFCTDDREPDFLLRDGHINQMCRAAVAAGLPAEQALLLATLHPARCHDLRDHGAIAPGYHANLVLLPDLISFEPELVIARGQVVAERGEFNADIPAVDVPDWVRSSVSIVEVAADDFAIDGANVGSDDKVRVIGIVEGQLLTHALLEAPSVHDGSVVADAARDLAKIAVVERHHATGRIGRGLVRGFGLSSGAFASTVAHDAHNIVVVGVDDASMAACANRMAQTGGGIVVADGGEVIAELALPIAGLLSDQPVAEVVEQLDALHAQLARQGVQVEAPFMILSFLALSVIPSLKITDLGLVDVDRFELVPLCAPAGTVSA